VAEVFDVGSPVNDGERDVLRTLRDGLDDDWVVVANFEIDPQLLMRFQTKRARDALHSALAAVPRSERRSQRTLLAQGALAGALLDEIERDGYHVLHQRIALTPVRKLWIAWRAK